MRDPSILEFLNNSFFSLVFEKINEKNHKIFQQCTANGVKNYGVNWLPLESIAVYMRDTPAEC